MADQGKWAKLHIGWDDDPHIDALSLEDQARWCKFVTYAKQHGTEGKVMLVEPARTLQNKFRVTTFDDVVNVLKLFPNYDVGEKHKRDVDRVTTVIVTIKNWHRWQGDFSRDRMRKLRTHVTAKKRGEEKRRRRDVEETRRETSITSPLQKFLSFVYLTTEEHQRLKAQLGSAVDSYLSRLDGYIGQIGESTAKAKYKSHYHTILNWHRKDLAEGKTNGTHERKSLFGLSNQAVGQGGHSQTNTGLRKATTPREILARLRDRELSDAHREEKPSEPSHDIEPTGSGALGAGQPVEKV